MVLGVKLLLCGAVFGRTAGHWLGKLPWFDWFDGFVGTRRAAFKFVLAARGLDKT